MKILFLARSLGRGGAERQLAQLARAFKEGGDEVKVAVFYAGGAFEEDLAAAGVSLIHLHKKGVWDVLGCLWRLVRASRLFSADVVYSFMLGPNILTVLAKPLLRNTRVVWGIRSSETDWRVYGRKAVVAARLERYLSRFATSIICNSETGRREMVVHGFPDERTITIANGIDTDLFHPDAGARCRMREEWGVGEDAVVVGLVARLDPHKGHKLFFDAAEQVLAKLPQAVFVCIGDGPATYARELTRYAAERIGAARVIWRGAQSNMVGAYNALDVLAITSTGEGFPNVLAEAMACGTPCVATRVGDAATILSDPRCIVADRSPADMAAAIVAVARLPRREAGEALRRRVMQEFSVEKARRSTRVVMESS